MFVYLSGFITCFLFFTISKDLKQVPHKLLYRHTLWEVALFSLSLLIVGMIKIISKMPKFVMKKSEKQIELN